MTVALTRTRSTSTFYVWIGALSAEASCDFWIRPARAATNAGSAITKNAAAMKIQLLRVISPSPRVALPGISLEATSLYYGGVLLESPDSPGSVTFLSPAMDNVDSTEPSRGVKNAPERELRISKSPPKPPHLRVQVFCQRSCGVLKLMLR